MSQRDPIPGYDYPDEHGNFPLRTGEMRLAPSMNDKQLQEREQLKAVGRVIDTHSNRIAAVQSLPVGADRIAKVFEARVEAVNAITKLISNAIAADREQQLYEITNDLYELADGNTGEGIWELHDKYKDRLIPYTKGRTK
jgi:hypothetical protein